MYLEDIIGNWVLIAESNEMCYQKNLFIFIYNFFEEIFGKDIMINEKCIIINEPNADVPMLITDTNPIIIRTCAASLNYWCQYIYQLSHELTHYAIRQQKHNKEIRIRWFEETLCEAMSLYILNISISRWSECLLFKLNPNYCNAIKMYFEDVHKQQHPDSVLKQCHSEADLQIVEDNCTINRAGRIIERNYIFDLFVQMPNDIKNIIYYTQYIRLNGIEIDFDKWESTILSSNNFVSRMEIIQPILIV